MEFTILVSNMKYGKWPHFLKVPPEIIGYKFKIYEKLKQFTLILMCRLIFYISAIFIFSDIRNKVTTCIQLTSSVCFMYILLTCMCQIYSLHIVYSNREMKIKPPKIESNLNANRSTLKHCNSKTCPMILDFLCDF
jgi:hypothetical protein